MDRIGERLRVAKGGRERDAVRPCIQTIISASSLGAEPEGLLSQSYIQGSLCV